MSKILKQIMLNRKLIEFLGLLSEEKHKKFKLFLTSPYFNNTLNAEKLIDLYEYIMKFKSKSQPLSVSKKETFKHFFPDKPFLEASKCELDSLASDLFKLCKQFLGQLKREEMHEAENLSMLEFYRLHGLEERFIQLASKVKTSLNNSSIRNSDYFKTLCKYDLEIINFNVIKSPLLDDVNLNSYNHHLDMAYSLDKLQAYCILKIQGLAASFEENIEIELVAQILKLSTYGKSLYSPINSIYQKVLDLLEGPINLESLNELSDLIEKIKNLVSFKEMKHFSALFRFFYDIIALSSPNKKERINRYKLYQDHFEKGYFYYDGKILSNELTTLVQMAIRYNDMHWAEMLLNTHTPERILGTKYAQEVYNLLWADYYYYMKNQEKALEKVEMRNFENPVYSIFADIILIKLYFDQRNDLLEYRLKALYQKVRRAIMSDYVKGRYFNFIKYLDKIQKIQSPIKENKKQKILQGILDEQNIYERDWLIEKTFELK